ncbi:MAG: discoidin domain-containing protein [Candidatus Solibacter sp.]
MRLRSQGRELPRSSAWRVSASPNGFEAALAFDNSYATRWSTWEAIAPFQRLQVELPAAQAIDEVVLECAPAWNAHLQVEILLDSGRWVPITDTVETAKPDLPTGIRRAAARDVKALGFRYLLINQGDMVYEDMKKYANYWGITELTEANGTHLFRID